jgi:uncharacterized protein
MLLKLSGPYLEAAFCITSLVFFTVLHLLFALFTFQRSLYFFGGGKSDLAGHYRVDELANAPNPVDVYVIKEGSKLDLVYMPGNAIFMEDYLPFCVYLSKVVPGNVVSYAYRGVGNDYGIPSELGISKELETVADYLNRRKTTKVLLGFSLGSAVSLKLSKLVKFHSIVLINPFVSLEKLVGDLRLGRIFKWMLVDKWDNLALIKDVKVPIYLIISGRDEIVPSKHGSMLCENLTVARKRIFENLGHNDVLVWPANFEVCVLPDLLQIFSKLPR